MNSTDIRALRRFGLETGTAFAALFGLLLPLVFHKPIHPWPWIIGSVLIAAALVYPRGLKPVQFVWMRLGHAIGWVNSRILLTLLFYVVLTPAGCVARWRGHDPLRRKYDPLVQSYREPVQARDPHHMERPF